MAAESEEKTSLSGTGSGLRVAVVGAGLAGIACARALTRAGHAVKLVEKARGPGGRMSSRRTEHGVFDHGAQYFTIRDPRFRDEVRAWIAAGFAREWLGRLAAIGSSGITQIKGDNRRYVGVPRMSAITRQLCEGSDLTLEWPVESIERHGKTWSLRGMSGDELGLFDLVVAAVPAPQAAPLLAASTRLADHAARVAMAGCCAAMLAFDRRLPLEFDGAFVNLGPLSWVARNSSKPGREPMETWVLHASPDWSEAHVETPDGEVASLLTSAFGNAVGGDIPEPIFAAAHHWRYALPVNRLDELCLFDSELGIGACGDWCGGPRVEGAFLSGLAVAERILSWREAGAGRRA